ncbi:uncharacterized protein KGF55_001243 [Candida pseudojiufengensis]|uniref:uncharacterized protein n=1 Tax=Candida pseudojiufengensis TaxID=497109 RepID=UPI0022254B3D|nr:uncharacterized protein KGF55_001243 [Candida pseudojiufengensis]KAI5965879.1 hypothetical protein KGF55_001243 [Candida pseudojiufengensis]
MVVLRGLGESHSSNYQILTRNIERCINSSVLFEIVKADICGLTELGYKAKDNTNPSIKILKAIPSLRVLGEKRAAICISNSTIGVEIDLNAYDMKNSPEIKKPKLNNTQYDSSVIEKLSTTAKNEGGFNNGKEFATRIAAAVLNIDGNLVHLVKLYAPNTFDDRAQEEFYKDLLIYLYNLKISELWIMGDFNVVQFQAYTMIIPRQINGIEKRSIDILDKVKNKYNLVDLVNFLAPQGTVITNHAGSNCRRIDGILMPRTRVGGVSKLAVVRTPRFGTHSSMILSLNTLNKEIKESELRALQKKNKTIVDGTMIKDFTCACRKFFNTLFGDIPQVIIKTNNIIDYNIPSNVLDAKVTADGFGFSFRLKCHYAYYDLVKVKENDDDEEVKYRVCKLLELDLVNVRQLLKIKFKDENDLENAVRRVNERQRFTNAEHVIRGAYVPSKIAYSSLLQNGIDNLVEDGLRIFGHVEYELFDDGNIKMNDPKLEIIGNELRLHYSNEEYVVVLLDKMLVGVRKILKAVGVAEGRARSIIDDADSYDIVQVKQTTMTAFIPLENLVHLLNIPLGRTRDQITQGIRSMFPLCKNDFAGDYKSAFREFCESLIKNYGDEPISIEDQTKFKYGQETIVYEGVARKLDNRVSLRDLFQIISENSIPIDAPNRKQKLYDEVNSSIGHYVSKFKIPVGSQLPKIHPFDGYISLASYYIPLFQAKQLVKMHDVLNQISPILNSNLLSFHFIQDLTRNYDYNEDISDVEISIGERPNKNGFFNVNGILRNPATGLIVLSDVLKKISVFSNTRVKEYVQKFPSERVASIIKTRKMVTLEVAREQAEFFRIPPDVVYPALVDEEKFKNYFQN